MNKSQIILAALGGTVVLGALALGYFIWDGSSVKAEKAEALDANLAAASAVMRKLPVRPAAKELEIYKANAAAYDEWRAKAAAQAAAGDLVFEKTTPAVLKTAIVAEAHKIADLPGCFDGKLVKPDFAFGFKDYITGGALPPDKPEELKRLQREWNDVAAVLKTIAEAGGVSAGIVDVRMGAAKVTVVEEEEEPKNKKRKNKKRAKAKVEEAESAQVGGPAITAMTVEFMTRPAGLVKALNAFATGTRFVVVENCTFGRERDELADKLGGDARAKSEASSGRAGRRRRGQAAQQTAEEEKVGGVVTDPLSAPLMKVTLVLSVYDFGTLEETQQEAKEESL